MIPIVVSVTDANKMKTRMVGKKFLKFQLRRPFKEKLALVKMIRVLTRSDREIDALPRGIVLPI